MKTPKIKVNTKNDVIYFEVDTNKLTIHLDYFLEIQKQQIKQEIEKMKKNINPDFPCNCVEGDGYFEGCGCKEKDYNQALNDLLKKLEEL